MILVQFPPCTGLGHSKGCIFYRASQNFYLGDGAFQGPDNAGGHITLVVSSLRKDIMHEIGGTACSGIFVVLVTESRFASGVRKHNGWTTRP